MGKKSDYTQWARILSIIGGALALIGIILSFSNDVVEVILDILAVFCTIVIFLMLGKTKKKNGLKFVWWQLLIVVIVQAILLANAGALHEIAIVGLVLEIIAVILLMLRDL